MPRELFGEGIPGNLDGSLGLNEIRKAVFTDEPLPFLPHIPGCKTVVDRNDSHHRLPPYSNGITLTRLGHCLNQFREIRLSFVQTHLFHMTS